MAERLIEQNGQWTVSPANGGGSGNESVAASRSPVRLKAMRLVRPVIGLTRISMEASTCSPVGSRNRA
ncbi:MAG: hypothetical protein MZV70_55760 [Desulfobacterales bacterium]|nr:hypothetical protein [Desulfobacterales bacterium]